MNVYRLMAHSDRLNYTFQELYRTSSMNQAHVHLIQKLQQHFPQFDLEYIKSEDDVAEEYITAVKVHDRYSKEFLNKHLFDFAIFELMSLEMDESGEIYVM